MTTLRMMVVACLMLVGASSAVTGPLRGVDPEDQPGIPTEATELYKKGYERILQENWRSAREIFGEFLKKWPNGKFSDDARYWSAYAEMHIDRRKAREEYREFVKRYPHSSYYSDAIADLTNLEAQLAPPVPEPPEGREDAFGDARGSGTAGSSSFSFNIPQLRLNMRHLGYALRNLGRNIRPMVSVGHGDTMDSATRLKLETLDALANDGADDRGFAVLQEIALDRSEPIAVRMEAMQRLADDEQHDATETLLTIAKTDTEQDVQECAISMVRNSLRERDNSADVLITLFQVLPSSRDDQRAMLLYEIADVGNDRAVDFLADVARSDANVDLRSDAIYYLGNIGGDRARAALYDLLRKK